MSCSGPLLVALQVVNEDGSLGTSAVYLFPHFETAGSRQFLEITTAAGQQVRCVPYATQSCMPSYLPVQTAFLDAQFSCGVAVLHVSL